MKRYEDHVRKDPDLFNAVLELEGKELGCCCKPFPCHGDVLIKLFKERQGTNLNLNPCISNSCSVIANSPSSPIDNSSSECPTRILREESDGNWLGDVKCTSKGQEIIDNRSEGIEPQCQGNGPSENNTDVSPPLRLTGGGNTSYEYQENLNSNYQGNDISENSITNSNSSREALSFLTQDNSMSEQDIRDVLFEAGYSVEAIENITSKSVNLNNSSEIKESDSFTEPGDKSAFDILRQIRVENVNRVMIGTLNINSLAPKFDQLREVIGKNLDILTIQETKLDASFPPQQFILDGYSEPYRLDRNRDGGGVLIYVREDIPSKELNKHNFTKYVEGLFIEINLRKTKLLFFGGYRSDHKNYGIQYQRMIF